MQVTGPSNLSQFLVPPLQPRPSGLTAAEGEDRLLNAGAPRPDKREVLFDAFFSSSRRIPRVEAFSPLAGFRVGEALRFFDRSSPSNGISLTASPDQRARFAGLQTSRLNRIEDSLRSLRGTVSRLLSQESLSTRTSESSRPDLVQARPGPDSPVTTFSVRPDRKASGNVLVSDAQPASVSTLGLSGTFFVNGFPVEVEPTDSLFDLRDKINRGEDRNGNGVLDRDEDVNQNGQVDRFGRDGTEFGPGVFVIEDLNGNGILDPAEDTNDNRRLDGGTRDLQVVARVRDQRLELTSLGGGNQRIDLRDEDNVLLALGFFELNAKGLPILNERQFADRNPPVNLNREPQTAKIDVEGQTRTSPTNTVPGVVEDTDLILKRASGETGEIRIFKDASPVVQRLATLFGQFNTAIGQINEVLTVSRAFDRDVDVQDLRNDLTRKPQAPTRVLAARNAKNDVLRIHGDNPRPVGFEVRNPDKNSVPEVSLSSAVQRLKNGMTFAFKNTQADLQERLTSIGIQTREDDTFAVDPRELDRALTVNEPEVQALLTDPDRGILPVLDRELGRILKEDLGDLDLKFQKLAVESGTPDPLTENFQQVVASASLKGLVQNLISVA